jgi:hypothetical protein
MVKSLSAMGLQAILTTGPSAHILDVRRRADSMPRPKKIPSARWHDPERTDDWIPTLPPDCDLAVYCVKGGGVSQSVADRLEGQDFRV